MDIFESVKEAVDLRRAADAYGMDVTRSGMVCCPFHRERTPSMKLYDDHFYCFGCHVSGDVIDLAAQLMGMGKYEAARTLARDFGVTYDSRPASDWEKLRLKMRRESARTLKDTENRLFRALAEYRTLLRGWRTAYAPTEGSAPDPRFLESLRMTDAVEYLCDVLTVGEREARQELVRSLAPRLDELEAYLRGLRSQSGTEVCMY